MIPLKSFLNTCFFLNEKFKKSEKNRPAVRVELGAFGSIVRCVTDGATRVHTYDGIFYQYKDKEYALRINIEFLSKQMYT